jgi:hypothetical protein
MKARPSQSYKKPSFMKEMEHIISRISSEGGRKVISFNQNADEALIQNFLKALGSNKASLHPELKDSITVKSQRLDELTSKDPTKLNEFYTKFIQLQKASMLEAIESQPGLNRYITDIQADGAIILEKSKSMSSIADFHSNNALLKYREDYLCSNKSERGKITSIGYFGPKLLKDLRRNLANEMKVKRGTSQNMFDKGIIAIEPVDIMFFNKSKFTSNFPDLLKQEMQKKPDELISTKYLKPKNSLNYNLFFLIPIQIAVLLARWIGHIIASPFIQLVNYLAKDKTIEQSSYRGSGEKTLDSKVSITKLSKKEIIENINLALEKDIAPLKSSILNGELTTLIFETHDELSKNTLSGRNKNCYKLPNKHMKTDFDNKNIPTHSKGLTIDGNNIEFYGQTEYEAREVVLHELMHVISHKIEHLDNNKYKADYQGKLQNSGKWLQQYCLDHEIEFETYNNLHIRRTIHQDISYHSDDGIGYMANLVPKLLQVRSIDPTAFDKEISRKGNPVAKLFEQLNIDAEAILTKGKGSSIER